MENTNANIDLIRSHVDTIILRSLLNEDKYGLEILNEIKTKSNGLYSLKQPTLYSCLKRLEKIGYIKSYKGDTSNGAQRVYYSLLQAGRDSVLQDQYQWEFSRTIMNRLLSDKDFDPTEKPPFDPTQYRPLTRRQSREDSSSDDETEATKATEAKSEPVIQYVYVDRPVYLQPGERAPQDAVIVTDPTEEQIRSAEQERAYRASVRPSTVANADQADQTEFENDTFDDWERGETSNDTDRIADEVFSDNRFNQPDEFPVPQSQIDPASGFSAFYDDPCSIQRFSTDQSTRIERTDLEKIETRESNSPSYRSQNDQVTYDFQQVSANYISSFDAIYGKAEDAPEVRITEELPEEHFDCLSVNELKIKLAQEGYTLKPYVKKETTAYYAGKYYFSNKLLFFTSLVFYLSFAVQIILTHALAHTSYGIGNVWLIVGLCVPLLYPVGCLLKYCSDPHKRTTARFNAKNAIVNALIVMINAIVVIILVGYFGFKADFAQIRTTVMPIVVPIILLLNIPIDIAIYGLCYRSKRFHIN